MFNKRVYGRVDLGCYVTSNSHCLYIHHNLHIKLHLVLIFYGS